MKNCEGQFSNEFIEQINEYYENKTSDYLRNCFYISSYIFICKETAENNRIQTKVKL